MSVLLDILLIAVLAICVVVGWKRGFIRALRGFVTYILSFAVSAKYDNGCGYAGYSCERDVS